jgi:hypothetical protein
MLHPFPFIPGEDHLSKVSQVLCVPARSGQGICANFLRLPLSPQKSRGIRPMEVEFEPWNFGMLEAVLANVHDIADAKRTAFQARLKNFHRLKFPVGFKMQKGKAGSYAAGDIMMMALAVELTQLGLSPEAVTRTLTLNWWPTTMALKMSAHSLIGTYGVVTRADGDDEDMEYPVTALPMFLYFDPAALSSLTDNWNGRPTEQYKRPSDTFFYGGIGVVKESIARWTSSDVSRISLVNVTSLMARIADEISSTGHGQYSKEVESFYKDVEGWASQFIEEGLTGHIGRVRDLLAASMPSNANKAAMHHEIRTMLRHLDLDKDAITELL